MRANTTAIPGGSVVFVFLLSLVVCLLCDHNDSTVFFPQGVVVSGLPMSDRCATSVLLGEKFLRILLRFQTRRITKV